MFNSMKNQFREKTGKELPKFTPQKGGLSRQSRQGSESSICSLVQDQQKPPSPLPESAAVPSPSVQQDSAAGSTQLKLADGKVLSSKDINMLTKKEEEWRSRMEKKEAEWAKKLDRLESELKHTLALKEEDWRKKEQELTEDLLKQTNELRDSLKTAEEYKRKLIQYQEEKDSIEGFQTQEMAKIKHLLLAKEKECTETSAALKELTATVDSLNVELSRLRPLEERANNCQDELEILRHNSEKEKWNLHSKLAQSEEQVRHLTDRVAVLTRRSESDAGLAAALPVDDRVQALLGERALLERRLEEAHVHLTDIKASWSAKIASLETQVGRLSRQAGEEGAERRLAETKVAELQARLDEETDERKRLAGRVAALSQECDLLASELKSANILAAGKEEELAVLTPKLETLERDNAQLKEQNNHLREELAQITEKANQLEAELSYVNDNIKAPLEEDRLRLENELRVENERAAALDAELSRERTAREEALLRNAQVSQQVDMARQELRQHHVDSEENLKRMNGLESQLEIAREEANNNSLIITELQEKVEILQSQIESKNTDDDGLRAKIADLEEMTSEKNKMIRVLQQKLTDMKKTLQRELKVTDNGGTEGMNNHVNNSSSSLKCQQQQEIPQQSTVPDAEVNFLYMKNVIMKFLTSREYEALHLTKAVATLLKLSAEEECLLKDTIGWRMSWFKTKPPKLEDYAAS